MRRRGNLKEYIASLEKEFSLIENGFKEEEKRALNDYKSNDKEYIKKLAFLAYKTCGLLRSFREIGRAHV